MTWLRTTIGQVCVPIVQRDPSTDGEGTFRYVDISGIDRETKTISRSDRIPCVDAPSRARKVIQRGDVLVSTVRPNLNAVAQVPDDLDDAIASTGFAVLRARAEVVDSRYLFYRVQHHEFVQFLTARATGASYPAVSDGIVRSAQLPLPPLSEQRRIVEILDEADGLKKLRREVDTQAARILPALFVKMLGDPATNPMEWPVKTGKQLFRVVRYGVGTPPPFTASGLPFLRAMNLKPEGVNRKNLVFFSPNDAGPISRSKVRMGDVVIVRRGANTGDCVVIPEEFDGAYVGYDLICEPATDTNSTWFAAAWNYPSVWQAIDALRTRAAQQGLNKDQIEAFTLPSPPKARQDAFATKAEMVAHLAVQGRTSAAKLATIFLILLQRAFSDELTAKWRDTRMKELLAEMQQQATLLNIPPSSTERLVAEA